MYEFAIDTQDKPAFYADLAAAADALTGGERDGIANMANVAALIWQTLPDLNWAGFYRRVGGRTGSRPVPGQAGLHPHRARQGRLRRRGCDARDAAASRTSTPFPATSPATRQSASELVVPLVVDGRLLGGARSRQPEPAAGSIGRCRGL